MYSIFREGNRKPDYNTGVVVLSLPKLFTGLYFSSYQARYCERPFRYRHLTRENEEREQMRRIEELEDEIRGVERGFPLIGH